AYECSNRKENGAVTCEGTTVREDLLLRGIGLYLTHEFLKLDGVALAWKAERGELKPGDLPEAFAKIKRLVSPPERPTIDRRQIEKRAAVLDGQIEKGQRNLVFLDESNIPIAQEEIRRLQLERERLEMELRRRPPTESDVNAEATAVLRSLYW